MRMLFYRLYVYSVKANVNFRHWLFQIRLSRHKAHLAQRDLSYLNLSGANLSKANLRGTNLSMTDLTGVKLHEADLRESNLKGALVTEHQLAQAKSLAGAIMPDGTIHS